MKFSRLGQLWLLWITVVVQLFNADGNDCNSLPCQNAGQCQDQGIGYVCVCSAGFTGVSCEIEINECDSNPCLNNATCVELINSYMCECAMGFTGENCVTEIDECDANPCLNNATCEDLINSYMCECAVGFTGENCATAITDCPVLSAPTNGGIANNSTSIATTVTFFCEDCYSLIGETNLTCKRDGTWDNMEPQCDVKSCSNLTTPENGEMSSTNKTCGSTIDFSCDECYELVGYNQLSCLPNETWTGEEPICSLTSCNRTLVAPINGTKNSNSTSCGTTVDFSCDSCFRVVGDEQLVCQSDGLWNGSEPVCELKYCRTLVAPINGTKNSNSTTCGTAVDFSCNSCFYLVGDKQLICQSDGLWDGSEPVCESAYVDLNKADNSTLDPPVIILEREAPRRFLVENPELLDVVGFDAKDWTRLELELHIPAGLEQNALFQETVEYKRDAAITDGRITLDEYNALSDAVGTGGGSITSPSVRRFLIDNEGSANLKHVLLSLQYNNDQDPILGETRFVELRVRCKQSVSRIVNITIQYLGKNENIPVVDIRDANADFVEGTTEAVAITNNSLSVSDADSDFFQLQSATVRLVHVANNGQGFNNEELVSTVMYSGITSNYNNVTGTLTFAGAGSEAMYSSLLNGVKYINRADDVGRLDPPFQLVQFRVSDGRGISIAVAVNVSFININDAPVLTVDDDDKVSNYSEGGPPVNVSRSILIVDSDDMQLEGATIVLSGAENGDIIMALSGTATGISARQPVRLGNQLTLILNGTAPLATYQTALASISYQNRLSHPAMFVASTKTLTFTVHDGQNVSNKIEVTINFFPVNDRPIVQFREDTDPNVFAPEVNRTFRVPYIEEGDSVQLLPDTTTFADVDSSNASSAQLVVKGLKNGASEELMFNDTLASLLGITANLSRNNTRITVILLGKAPFTDYLHLLFTFLYINRQAVEPLEGIRLATLIVFDDKGDGSDPAFIQIDVQRRNDNPQIDLGGGINMADNLTFQEIPQGDFATGIHISNQPHRIEIFDEEEARHYIVSVTVTLGVFNCPDALEGAMEYIYLLGIIDGSLIEYIQNTSGRQARAVPAFSPSNSHQFQSLEREYELFLSTLRYINLDDEPVLYCPNQANVHVQRYIEIAIVDSGAPPRNVTLRSWLNIESVADVSPVVTVQVDGDCVVEPAMNGAAAEAYEADVLDRKRREDLPRKSVSNRKAPDVVSVEAVGYMGSHLQAGSTVSVKFSHKTNTPAVLRPVDMNRVLQLHPHVLNELPHLGVWTDSQTLWIIFPSVKKGVIVYTSDLIVEFTGCPGLCNVSDVCEVSVCHMDCESFGVRGSYGVSGKQEQEESTALADQVATADDIQQTQLHDWSLLILAATCFGVAVMLAVVAGLKGKRLLSRAAKGKTIG